jgi:long-chain acyl-CoA synthetase
VYARSLKSREIREDIAANRANLMCGVPLLYEKLYHAVRRGIASAPPLRRFIFAVFFALSSAGWRLGRKWGKFLFSGLRQKADLGSIRMFVSGGAALPPMIARFFNLVGIDLLQGYGLTETSPVVSVNRPDDIKFGSVGPPLDGVEVRIDQPDAAGIGEVLIRGDNVTPGYRDNPEETAKLVRDDWLYTGDLGRVKKGHLWITGRAKNVIVSAAGKNIYPEELEEKLLESQYILEVLVLGKRKQGRQGEEIAAIVVPDLEQFRSDFDIDPKSPDSDQIRRILKQEVRAANGRMADYKRVQSFEVSLEELEKTSSKKVKRYRYAQR